MSILDDLERLEQAATAGPWQAEYAASWVSGKREITEWFVRLDGDDVAIAADIIDPRADDAPSEPNARFIAAARNALPALLAVARALKDCAEVAHAGRTIGFPLEALEHIEREALAALAALEAQP